MRLHSWLDLFAARMRFLSRLTPRFRRSSRRSRPSRTRAGGSRGLRFEQLEERVLLSAPHNLDLGGVEFDGSATTLGYRFTGFAAGQEVGHAVTTLGDINGDGMDDIAIGTYAGNRAFIVFGGSNLATMDALDGVDGVIDLSLIDGTNGFVLTSSNGLVNDRTGVGISGGGDFNGDGTPDILVTLPRSDAGGGSGNTNRGRAFVIFGGTANLEALDDVGGTPDDGIIDLFQFNQAPNTAGSTQDGWGNRLVRIDGFQNGARAGESASFLGDLNGDGFDDIGIGSPNWDADTNNSPAGNQRGEAYVVFGKFVSNNNGGGWFDNSVVNVNSLGSNGYRITGSNDWANGTRSQAGFALSGVGDVNGDGLDDFAVTVIGEDGTTENNAGATYLIFGAEGLPGGSVSLAPANFNGTNGVSFHGIGVGDLSGSSVSGAGDVNGDGYDDFIIGAPNALSNGVVTGQAYVIFGKSSWNGTQLLIDLGGDNGFMINGINVGDRVGAAVGGGGDINGDGFDDILVGANAADPNGGSSGQIYVIYGRSTGFDQVFPLQELDGTNGFRMHGPAANFQSGRSIAHAGDLNGDGFADFLVGAPNATVGAYATAGVAFVVYGGNFSPSGNRQIGGPGPQTLTGNQGTDPFTGVDILIGGPGDDILISDGGPDVLIGGPGDDTFIITDNFFAPTPNGGTRRIQGGTGFNTLIFMADGATLDLTAIPDNRIQNINYIDIRGVVHPETYGTGNNTLVITPRELFNLSDYQARINGSSPNHSYSELWVRRDAGDEVITTGFTYSGDTLDADPNSDSFGVTFQIWASSTNSKGGRAFVYIEDPAVITPLQLNGDRGYRFRGNANGDQTGISVSGAGDINGDGYDDFLIGAYNASPGGLTSAGRTYVVFGNETGYPTNAPFPLPSQLDSVALGALNGTHGFIINGLAIGDALGYSVAGAGDVNGDGFADFLIGAFKADPNGRASSGETYLIFGSSTIGTGGTFDLSTLDGTNGYRIQGMSTNDFSGFSVAGAGDVNGDGYADILIGAKQADPGASPGVDTVVGETYLIFGGTAGLNALDAFDGPAGQIRLAISMFSSGSGLLDGTHGLRLDGVNQNDTSGTAVGSAGDINGDGIDDLLIGAPLADRSPGEESTGDVYVLFGREDWQPLLTPVALNESATAVTLKLGALDGTSGFRIRGIDPYDLLGISLSSAGDINGDGFEDVIIGAHRAEAAAGGTGNSGEAYVVFGKAGSFGTVFDLTTLNGSNGFAIRGLGNDNYLGWSVDGIGDFNGDGFDDIIVGARRASAHGAGRSGQAYVIFGREDWTGVTVFSPNTRTAAGLNIGLAGFRIDGLQSNDYLGQSVSAAGDVNGDGFADLIVGAYRAELFTASSNTDRGEAYIIFGGPDTFLGLSRPQYIGDGTNLAADEVLRTGDNTNADFFAPPLGAGNRDIFVGFQGHDDFTSLGGNDVFRGGQGNDFFRIPDTDFSGNRNIDGGTGVDTLALTGGGQTLDLTAIANTQIKNIEIIDIRGGDPDNDANALILNASEVRNISAGGIDAVVGAFTTGSLANVLMVLQDRNDVVTPIEGFATGTGWTKGAVSLYLTVDTDNAGGQLAAFFESYTFGNTTLLLQSQTVVLNGTTVSVIGTGEDDHFEWDSVNQILKITTDGVTTEYDLSTMPGWIDIHIDGLAGNDSITFIGTVGDDIVEVNLDEISFENGTNPGVFELTSESIERLAGFDGAGGTGDEVRLTADTTQTLDLTGIDGTALINVEIIDITGGSTGPGTTSNNQLILDLTAAQTNISSPLTVLRDLGDTVSGIGTGDGWTIHSDALWDAGRDSFFVHHEQSSQSVHVQDVYFSHDGAAIGTLIGTSGDDAFGYSYIDQTASLNGITYDLTLPTPGIGLMLFNGLGGTDSIAVVGSFGDDLLSISPTSITLGIAPNMGINVMSTTNIERLASFDGESHFLGDEVRLVGSGQTLNLTGPNATTLVGVELIDVRVGMSTLNLDFTAAQTNLSTPLTILRDPNDVVNIGGGWSLNFADWDAGRQSFFENYTQGLQTLRVQTAQVEVVGSQANVFGTGSDDVFIYNAVTQVMLINGVAFNLSDPAPAIEFVNVDGLAGNDSIHVIGTAGADTMVLTGTTTTNYEYNALYSGFDLTAVNVEQRSLDGAGGNDTIILPGANQTLNLTTGGGAQNKSIEFIDITGTGNNTLILSPTWATSNVSTPVRVNRNTGDTVQIGGGWTQAVNSLLSGGKFYDVFNASGKSLQVESLQVIMSGSTANVLGTNGNDSLAYDAQSNLVTINGINYQLPGSVTFVSLNGLAGTDTLSLFGTAGNDKLVSHPGIALFEFNPGQAGFDFVGTSVETILVNGRGQAGGIGDTATLYDSASDDEFTANPFTASLIGGGFNRTVSGFEQIVASAANGGNDRAAMNDGAGNDVFSASPTVANLSGPGFLNQALGFDQVTARANNGGTNMAFLTDSASSDTFTSNAVTRTGSMTGPGYLNTAINFNSVSGNAVSGGHDTAFLIDSAGNDKFVSKMNVSFLDSGSYLAEATLFEVVSGRAINGGNDQAFLYDSPAADTFTGTGATASIVPNAAPPGPGQYREATGFDLVAAWSVNGGRDRANLFDTAGNDVVSIRPEVANFSSNGVQYLQALGFTLVTARSVHGGQDFAFLFDSAADDAFVGTKTTATLYAQGPVPAFVSEVIGFKAVSARASTGNDLATLFDSSGNDKFTSNARTGLATLQGVGFFNETVGFDQVFAYASLGVDQALMTDSTGVDTFFGRNADGRMSGSGFSHVASGFDSISIFSPNGPGNILDIANLQYAFSRSGTWV